MEGRNIKYIFYLKNDLSRSTIHKMTEAVNFNGIRVFIFNPLVWPPIYHVIIRAKRRDNEIEILRRRTSGLGRRKGEDVGCLETFSPYLHFQYV